MKSFFRIFGYFHHRPITKTRRRSPKPSALRWQPAMESLEDRDMMSAGLPAPYPFASSNPLTSVAFNESDVVVGSQMDTAKGAFEVWYSDEHALALGVRQVNVITANGTTTTNYPITAMTGDPSAAVHPAVGATATTGAQAGVDASSRPMFPSLFVTDITTNPSSTSGDWQYGGTAVAPDAVFGAWKAFVKTVDETKAVPAVSMKADKDPAKNGWNLGPGADTPPAGLKSEGYTAEVRWNLNDLYNQGVLTAGHNYRFYVIIHDGDQNKAGGDAGQAVFEESYAGPALATLSGYVKDVNSTYGTTTPVSGLTVTLTGVTDSGQSVTLTTTTAADGSYKFTGLDSGTYTVTETVPANAGSENGTVGTVNGIADGTAQGPAISGIQLSGGDNGVNYDFSNQFLFAGSS